jgi:hypothetical protein
MQQCSLPQMSCCIQCAGCGLQECSVYSENDGNSDDNTEVLIRMPCHANKTDWTQFLTLIRSSLKSCFSRNTRLVCINQMWNKCNKGLPITCQTCNKNICGHWGKKVLGIASIWTCGFVHYIVSGNQSQGGQRGLQRSLKYRGCFFEGVSVEGISKEIKRLQVTVHLKSQ